jgi:hypothetical protein
MARVAFIVACPADYVEQIEQIDKYLISHLNAHVTIGEKLQPKRRSFRVELDDPAQAKEVRAYLENIGLTVSLAD